MTSITNWTPENEQFWAQSGKKIANINLIISVGCLLLAFVVWTFWAILAVKINDYGFNFSKEQLFTLLAIPGVVGATLRIFYSFITPILGGRTWTTISTALLLIPTLGLSIALQNPNTSYDTFIILAICCGFGGGNFSSSMANISLFFPKRLQGSALGINGGIGNLGVSVFQLIAPLTLGFAFYGKEINGIYLSSAIALWVPFIILFTLLAAFKMTNLPNQIKPLEQFRVFKRRDMYLTTILYTFAFGTFIGCSVAFPLVAKIEFKDPTIIKYAFVGPMLGSIARVIGGFLADKFGGKKLSLIGFAGMGLATIAVIYFIQPTTHNLTLYLIAFFILFSFSGLANGAIFQLIGLVMPGGEKAPALGLSAAIAAYGSAVLPKLFGWSINSFNSFNAAFMLMIICFILGFIILTTFYRKVA